MRRRLLALSLLALSLLGAAPAGSGASFSSGAEAKAWKAVEVALDQGAAERILTRAEAYIEAWPDGAELRQAHRIAGNASMALDEWKQARRHFEAYLEKGGRDELDDLKYRLAVCLAREGRSEDAQVALRNVASQDPDADRGAEAARELVALLMFEGKWKEALEAQSLLFQRDRFDLEHDLPHSRRAISFLSDAALEQLERQSRDELAGGLVAYLLLDRAGALVDSEDTLPARRRFADAWGDHPLAAQVPGIDALREGAGGSGGGRVLGVLLPLSGKYGLPGQLALRGIELGLQESAAEGRPGITLLVEDTAGDPGKASEALRKLVGKDGATVVLGPMLTAEAEALVPLAEELGVPLLMMLQKSGLAAGTRNTFNHWVTVEEQVDALLEHAMGRLGLQSFALCYPAKEGGGRLAERFWQRAEAMGGRVAAAESYSPEATDFRVTGQRLKGSYYKAKPPGEADIVLPFLSNRTKPHLEGGAHAVVPGMDFQAIFVPDDYRRAGMLAAGLLFEEINLGGKLPAEDYPKVTLLGGAALNHPDLISKGGKVTEGTVLVDGFFLGSPDPEVQRFVAAYRAAHGADPSILEAIAYDSALFVAQILDGGADSRREMRRALRLSTPARTVTNARGFDPQGEMRHEMLTLMVHGGAIVQVWPPPPAEQLAPGGAATEGGAMLPQGR